VKLVAEHREAVVFPNQDGLSLFGILHRPVDVLERPIGIIFLSPGVKSRVAPHRLYVKMTEALLEQGYPVLRFDFFGLGDSEGELPERELADLYAKVQDGRYLQDTLCAMDWMQRHLRMQQFVLAGLCGGALTALFAAEKDTRVRGVLGLGLPVALDGRVMDASKYMTQGQLNDVGGTYLNKVFKPGAWLRAITLKTDFRMLGVVGPQSNESTFRRRGGRRGTSLGVRREGRIGEVSARYENRRPKCATGSEASNLNPSVSGPTAFFRLDSFTSNTAENCCWYFSGARSPRGMGVRVEKFAQPIACKRDMVDAEGCLNGDSAIGGYEVHTIPIGCFANHIKLSDPAMMAIRDAGRGAARRRPNGHGWRGISESVDMKRLLHRIAS
jgi:alpha/beta superfamily hydrolase